MPTGRGWAALGVAAALLVLWLGFGEQELMATAAFLLAAVAVGLFLTRSPRVRIEAARRLHPLRAHEGDTVSIELDLAGRRRLRHLTVEDTVHGLGVARFAVAATPAGTAIARYQVSCRSRGVFGVGPATAIVGDPLGLTERATVIGTADRLTVYPRLEPLTGIPVVQGRDPTHHAARPTFAPHGGEDFYTLREYQVGDDLRRVHWPSSAKRDALIIKQLEIPWQARGLVLLDVRAERYPVAEAFEQAVRGAASVLTHLQRCGFTPDLWVGDRATGSKTADRHQQAMDALAVVKPVAGLDHRGTVSRLHRKGAGGGVLILVTGEPDEGGLAIHQALAADFACSVVLVVSERGDAVHPFRAAGAITVPARPGGAWAPAWRIAMEMSWATASAG